MKYKFALLFSLFSLSLYVQGQTTGKAIIHGNVYGGGEAAKVEQPAGQRGNMPAAKVTLRNGAEVYGAIFGAGKGYTKGYVDTLYQSAADDAKKTYKDYASIKGDAEVNLTGKSVIWRDMFGGGENADVDGSTFFNMSDGEVAANVFGGGRGDFFTKNSLSFITSADVSGNTSINITGGSLIWNRTSITKAGKIEYDRYWYIVTVAAADGHTDYTFDKVQTAAEIEAIKANFPARDYENVTISEPIVENGKQKYTVSYTRKEYTKKEWSREQLILSDPKYANYALDTSTYQDGKEHVVINTVAGDVWSWDPTKASTYKDDTKKIDNSQFYSDTDKRFLIEHNIFGGGYIASKVGTWTNGNLKANTGLSKVRLTKGLFDMDLIKTDQWKTAYNDHEHPHFYIFGGGYGIHTKVGKSDVYAALPIDASIGSTMETEEQLAKSTKPRANTTSGETKEFKFDIINNSYGLPRATVLGILGGGYNGYVGSTNVVIGGATFTHRVYGGGLGSFEGWTDAGSPTTYVAQNDNTGYTGVVSGNTMVTLIGGHIYGDAFGGGAGVAPKKNGGFYTDYPEIARVNGTTTVRTFSSKDYYNFMKDSGVAADDMPYVWAEGNDITTPNIYGSVYGGGDVANVTANANVELRAGNVFGYTIGAGYGRKATQAHDYTTIGKVGGDSKVIIEDGASAQPYAWNDIYGGGRNGLVGGSAYVYLNGGNIGDNVFGGGWGAIDNPGHSEIVTSANVAGNTIVTIDKTFALWNKVADVEGNIKTWNRDDYIREATNLNGVDPLFYNAETKRFVHDHNIYGGGNVACVVGTNGDETKFTAGELTASNNYLRATLKAGAYKTGNTIVMMNETHVSDPDLFYNHAEWTDDPRWSQAALCWLTTLTEQREPQFSVFGGGYGLRTKTLHDAQARVEVLAVKYRDPEKTQLKYVDDNPENGPVEHWTTGWDYDYEHKLEWTDADNNGGTAKSKLANFFPEKTWLRPNYVEAERRLRTAAFAKQIGVAGNSVMQVVGGGYNGSVVNNTYASAQSRVLVGKVYGGGYGSFEGWQEAKSVSNDLASKVGTVGGTATVDIDRGSLVYGDVFGGGAGVESQKVNGTLTDFPDVAKVGSTQVKFGEKGASEKYDFVVPVIFGSLYGGGDVANVTGNATTDLWRGQVMQYVFGGGNGRLKNQCANYSKLGSVHNTTLTFHEIRTKSDGTSYSKFYGDVEQSYIHEPYVWHLTYGGGRNGIVTGNTNITINGGQFGHNIFGGGWGAITNQEGKELTDEDGIVDPEYADREEDKDYFITSADVKGNTNITVLGGSANIDQIWDAENRKWEELIYDENGEPYTPQYDFVKTIFLIKHNIYTGGHIASNIGTLNNDGTLKSGGNTNLTMKRGMLNSQYFETFGNPFLESWEWRDVYKKHGTPFFCLFGGGYGEHATVHGDTNVKVDMIADNKHLNKDISPVDEDPGHNHTADGTGDVIGCYGDHHRMEKVYTKFPDGQSLMDVVGGGYNGPVKGTCNITIDGSPFIRNVFGGAYYSPVGSTNINVLSGNIDNIYGGGMLGDVENKIVMNIGSKTGATNTNASALGSAAEENHRLIILGDIYGGNDVSGLAGAHYDDAGNLAMSADGGVTINLNGGHIKGNVYGGGNGNYLYMIDPEIDPFDGKVTADEHHIVNGKEKLVYRVPMRDAFGSFYASNEVQRLINIATYRPVTIKTEITMQGNTVPADEADYLKIDGSVFGGGNSATVSNFNSSAGGGEKVGVTLNIGSNINVGSVFLGNDGEAMFTNEANNSFLRDYPELNNIKLSNLIDWNDVENQSINETYFTTPKAVRPDIYKNMLDLYFLPVEMSFVPKVYWGTGNNKFIGNTPDVAESVFNNTTIGTFCCGGNRGNMTTSDHVSLVFPKGLTITDKIVGGCNDANYQMGVGSSNVTEHVGGYLYGTHQFAYTQDSDGKFTGGREATAPQIHLVMKNKFRLKTDDEGNYLEGGNVYGGCYKSGNVRGDIELDMRADMLVDEDGNTLPEDYIEKIRTAFEDHHHSVASIYGAGYGTNTFVYGDTRVTLGNETAKNAGTHGNGATVYNLFGGGQQGNLIGNSHVQIINGRTAGNTVGGSYAGYQYGSTNVIVGYPRYYVTQQTGQYTLLRKDNDETHLNYVDENGNIYVKQEIYLLKGAGVSKAVMDEITAKDGEAIATADKETTYFKQITSHYTPASFGLNWNQVDINVNRAIYGGGYSLASGSSVGAGAKTVCKMTEKYNMDDFKELYGLTGSQSTLGYGGNTNVMLCDLTPNNETTNGSDDKAATCDNDHITLSTGVRTQVLPQPGDPLFGLYYELDGTYIYVNDREAKYLTANHTGLQSPTEADMKAIKYYRYTGEGGLFGDGHLSLSEGFRFGEMTRYGFAGTTPHSAKLMNCIHRFDIVRVKDCCMSLMGDRDYVSTSTGGTDTTPYSIARVGELQMTSDIEKEGATALDASRTNYIYTQKRKRNYIGLSSNVRNLGCLFSDVSTTSTRHKADGTLDNTEGNYGAKDIPVKSYEGYKAQNIAENYDYNNYKVDVNTDKQKAFMLRNDGTAHNLVGIASGMALLIQDEARASKTAEEQSYYGPLKGVIEVSLINVIPGEAGGYVYAHNNHASDKSFLEEEGNVVYPIDNQDSGRKLVDDCFPQNYSAKYASIDGHYWYVTGYKYFYECNISAYTSDAKDVAKKFAMAYNLGSLKLTDYMTNRKHGETPYLNKIIVNNFRFLPHDASDDDYTCDINRKYNYNGVDNTGHTKVTDFYDLVLKIEGVKENEEDKIIKLDESINGTKTIDFGTSTQNEPVVNIYLIDKVENNAMDAGDGKTYFEKYLSKPCKFEIQLEVPDEIYKSGTSKPVDETYTYTITTTIQYVQGPNYTGDIDVSCALPGEMIRLSKKNLKIKTDEIAMPKIAEKWEVCKINNGTPGTYLERDDDDATLANRRFTIDAEHTDGLIGGGDATELPNTFYDKTDDYIYIPAYYYMNGYGVKYSFKVQGVKDWIPVTINPAKSLLVHNYHRMKTGKDEGGKDVDVKIRKAAERAATDGTPLPRVYIEDAEDMAALKNYLTEANDYGANVDFHLMKDITVPSWAAPTTFAGNFHGNGYKLDLNGGNLFATNSGNVYNLGMNNSSVATTNTGAIINSYAYGKHIAGALSGGGTLKNCYTNQSTNTLTGETYASEDEWKYGKVAYDLNGYYIERRGSSPAISDSKAILAKQTLRIAKSASDPYVEKLYENGDYQYARQKTEGGEFLRTNNLPHYGGKTTYHITTHDVDEARAHYETVDEVKTFRNFQPLYESAKIDDDATTTTPKNDYLFFGQQIQKDKDILPSVIIPTTHAVAEMSTRVYRAYGYMHSKLHGFNATTTDTDPGFYFNRMVNVYNPALTAINFSKNTESDMNIDIPLAIQKFNLDETITRNLLVYTESDDALTYDVVNNVLNYNETKEESNIKGHQLVKLAEADGNGNLFAANAGLFHLVERATESQPNNDFNAPISFSVGTRAWYTRQPKYYAEHDNDAWEGIALPFTANKVVASLNGEITHFYGMPTQDMIDHPETNDKTLHHEYWLRGLTAVTDGTGDFAGKKVATFQRPGTESGLFTTDESMSYSFTNNWFVDTYTKNYNYDDPSNQNKWYSEPHTFVDYMPLAADVPYIVSFPGNRYYEFDLSSQFYNDMMKTTESPQTVTFNNYLAEGSLLTIEVTDYHTRSTSANGYYHNATYSAIDNAGYGISADGTFFNDDVHVVLPFRTYMTAPAGSAKSSVFIGSRGADNTIAEEFMNPGHSDNDSTEPGMNIYSRDKRLFVESNYPTTLMVHTYGGQLYRVIDVREGTNMYSGFAAGIYLVNGKKLVIR